VVKKEANMKQWKILESTYLRPRFRLDQCELPNGKMLEALMLEFHTWANVVAITKDQKVVLVRQYRHGPRMDFLEFPGGVIEDDEDPLLGAQRELLEETGYKAAQVIETGRLYANPALQTNQLFCYVAFDAEKVETQNLDDGEDIEVELVSLDELIALCKEGKFLHALDVAVFFQALLYLQRIA
jgi:8-oxo-dGTP pyrophosphatase MutT (NUDIX family)